MTIFQKKGDMRDIEHFRLLNLLSHTHKLSTQLLQRDKEKILDENQARKQASFWKGYLTIDHLQTINQLIEKCKDFNLTLCIRYTDPENAFDTTEHRAIFKALRTIDTNGT